MTNVALDFRFAWRWLLPLQGCQRALLRGFNTIEQQFWQNALAPCKSAHDEQHADAWIVNADRYKQVTASDIDALANVRAVCVFGNGSAVTRWRLLLNRSFLAIQEYGLLPHSQPRVVVPLDSPRNAAIALRLHRPGRRLARLGLRMARLLAGIGIFLPLRRRMLLIAVREPSTMPLGAAQADLPTRLPDLCLSYALYLGTADDNRKTVVLPLGSSDPRIILKVGATPKARRSLKNEADTLEALQGTALGHHIPRLTGLVENDKALTLFQEYRPRQTVAQRTLDKAVVAFLVGLSTINRRSRPLAYVLREIASRDTWRLKDVEGSDTLCAVWGRLQSLGSKEIMVWEHRYHGDFGPWNCAWTEQGLFVFDWEESQARELAFGDAFYYVVAIALHVAHKPDPVRTVQDALGFAARVASASGFEKADLTLYFALWALQQLGKAPFYGLMLQALGRVWR